jgi:hypothetical protein
MAMPSCSLDDIDLAALKVSEIVQVSAIAKVDVVMVGNGFMRLDNDMEVAS